MKAREADLCQGERDNPYQHIDPDGCLHRYLATLQRTDDEDLECHRPPDADTNGPTWCSTVVGKCGCREGELANDAQNRRRYWGLWFNRHFVG